LQLLLLLVMMMLLLLLSRRRGCAHRSRLEEGMGWRRLRVDWGRHLQHRQIAALAVRLARPHTTTNPTTTNHTLCMLPPQLRYQAEQIGIRVAGGRAWPPPLLRVLLLLLLLLLLESQAQQQLLVPVLFLLSLPLLRLRLLLLRCMPILGLQLLRYCMPLCWFHMGLWQRMRRHRQLTIGTCIPLLRSVPRPFADPTATVPCGSAPAAES